MSIIEQALQRMRKAEPLPDGRQPRDAAAVRPVASARLTDVVAAPAPIAPRRTVHIDPAALRNAGLLPVAAHERQIEQQFRRIKRPVIEQAFAPDKLGGAQPGAASARLIMLASALSGEGKTFCSVNLALSLARERDLDVVIVDADVAKQNISTVLGVAEEPGLLDALADDTLAVESLILPTNIERLSVLPAGRRQPEFATELLSSGRMRDLMARVVTIRPSRIVVFDSPPLLLTTESEALIAAVGQILLVVRAGATPREAVMNAIGMLGEGKPVGLVLNQNPFELSDAYYYYGATDAGART